MAAALKLIAVVLYDTISWKAESGAVADMDEMDPAADTVPLGG